MTFYKTLRKDLIIHHGISILATLIFWNKIYLIHLSMLLESSSMFNAIPIIVSKIIRKLLCIWRIYCILIIRFGIYMYGSVVLFANNYSLYLPFPFLFVCLDTYWLCKNIEKFNHMLKN